MSTTTKIEFNSELHQTYVLSLEIEKPDRFEYWVTEHMRVSGIYWGFVAMSIMNALDRMDTSKAADFVLSCQKEDGGFGGHVVHDSHLVSTYNALQVLVMTGNLGKVDADKVANWIKSLQNEDGSFSGDKWGEIDTRFVYCAFGALSLLKKLDVVDVKKGVQWILSCKNFDGGFGVVPGAESHAGQTFCCIGALAIVNGLDLIDKDLLAWWLAERQLPNGGLNGRPEKLADVCYSWWVLSSLAALEKVAWIDGQALTNFILSCQDLEDGGISDKPGNVRDVYHTCFGCTGLSLLGHPGLAPIDYRYCLPKSVVDSLQIPEPEPIIL